MKTRGRGFDGRSEQEDFLVIFPLVNELKLGSKAFNRRKFKIPNYSLDCVFVLKRLNRKSRVCLLDQWIVTRDNIIEAK